MTPGRGSGIAAQLKSLATALNRPAALRRGRVLAALISTVLLVRPLYQWRHHTVFRVYTDFDVYRRAAVDLAHGSNIYAPVHGLPFTYPPFAAVFVLPLAVPNLAARIVITTVSIAAGLFATSRCLRWAWPARVPPVATVVSTVALPVALMLTEPMRITIWLGQINAVLMAIIVIDVLWVADAARIGDLVRAGRWLPRGVLTGVATGVKLTPAVFILFLLTVRRRRAAVIALATFAATVLLGFEVTPHGAFTYWTKLLWDTNRVGQIGRYGNQSLLGLLTRTFGNGTLTHLLWIAGSLAAIATGLLVAARAQRNRNPVLAVGVVGVISSLISPISWTHHWVWCIPVFAGLLVRVDRRGWWSLAGAGAWLAVFEVGPNSPLAKHLFYGWTPSRVLIGNCYVIAGVALLVSLAAGRDRAESVRTTPVGTSQSPDRIPTP